MAVINPTYDRPKGPTIAKEPIVELDPNKFEALVENQGVRVNLYTTLLCPNVKKPDSNEHEIGCPLCYGSAFIDVNPVETMTYLSNQRLLKRFEQQGVFDEATTEASFLPGVNLQYFARIDLIDFASIYYQIIQKQEGSIDRLKYQAYSVNYLIDKNGVTYTENTDFEVTSDTGDIKWLKQGPSIGTMYSVHYNYPIVFRAVNALHVNRFGQNSFKKPNRVNVELPEQWIIKRDYLITKEDVDGNPISDNRIFVQTTSGV